MRSELERKGMRSLVTLVAADERIASFAIRYRPRTLEKTLLLVTCAKRGGLIVSLSRIVTHRTGYATN